jgi:hypothetical protein
MEVNPHVLVLEDDSKDLWLAVETARAVGFYDVEAFVSLEPAMQRIEEGLRGERPLPGAIVLASHP